MFWKDKKSGIRGMAPLFLPWILIAGGVIFTFLQSINLFNPLSGNMSWNSYAHVLGSRMFWRSLSFSVYVAFVTAALSTAIGFGAALLFWRLPIRWQKFSLLYKIFLILPHISVAYLILLIFSQTGVLSSLLYKIGIIRDYRAFPILIFDNRGIGIILGYLMKEIPFAILLISALMRNIPEDTIITAKMLGASPGMVVLRIIVPETSPGIVTSFFILYLYAFGAFEIPFILGGSKPVMLSITIYDLLFRKDFSYRPEAMAMLILVFLLNLSFILLYLRISRNLKQRREIQ
jgi:putative spermidine/putrescine transport system permease protein